VETAGSGTVGPVAAGVYVWVSKAFLSIRFARQWVNDAREMPSSGTGFRDLACT